MSAAPQVQALWNETFGPNANSEYAGKAYFIATNNWDGMTYPYSTALYSQSGGFSNGYVPLFGVIGNGNVVYYDNNGFSSVSAKLKAAIDGFSPNAVIVTNPIEDLTMSFGEMTEIDLANVFSTEEGTLSYEVESVSIPEALTTSISGTILTLTAGNTPASVTVKVKAINGDYSATDKFNVLISGGGEVEVILEEGFENGIPDDWLNLDEDGDGFKWDIGQDPAMNCHSGTQCVASASWAGGSALNPDNWLIISKVTLNTGNSISYWVCGQDASYAEEHYGVYISETGTDIADFTLLFEETIEAKGGSRSEDAITRGGTRTPGNYYEKIVPIPDSYDSKSVYIAFRHFDVSDMFMINLDDIKIETTLSIDENNAISPKSVELLGNYPNPFNPNTTISFKLNNAAKVKLTVFDVKGQLVEELLNNKLNAGIHNVDFNAAKLNSGVYYYRVEAGDVNITKKMLLIK